MADCLATHILKFPVTSGKEPEPGARARGGAGKGNGALPWADNASGTGGPRPGEAGLRELAGSPLRVGVRGGTGRCGAAFVGPILAG